jgi:hypothetical protein
MTNPIDEQRLADIRRAIRIVDLLLAGMIDADTAKHFLVELAAIQARSVIRSAQLGESVRGEPHSP